LILLELLWGRARICGDKKTLSRRGGTGRAD